MMPTWSDNRTRAQRWADTVTEFSGSWSFIGWFVSLCIVWIVLNASSVSTWDPYPFLFLNWILSMVSTFQNPLILLSHNRRNEIDRAKWDDMLSKLDRLQQTVDELKKGSQ